MINKFVFNSITHILALWTVENRIMKKNSRVDFFSSNIYLSFLLREISRRRKIFFIFPCPSRIQLPARPWCSSASASTQPRSEECFPGNAHPPPTNDRRTWKTIIYFDISIFWSKVHQYDDDDDAMRNIFGFSCSKEAGNLGPAGSCCCRLGRQWTPNNWWWYYV